MTGDDVKEAVVFGVFWLLSLLASIAGWVCIIYFGVKLIKKAWLS